MRGLNLEIRRARHRVKRSALTPYNTPPGLNIIGIQFRPDIIAKVGQDSFNRYNKVKEAEDVSIGVMD